MAARKQLFHPDEVKKKIQASQLINRLTKHALSKSPLMDASQVTTATKLLNKVVPDLRAVEHSGRDGEPIDHRLTLDAEKLSTLALQELIDAATDKG